MRKITNQHKNGGKILPTSMAGRGHFDPLTNEITMIKQF